MRTWYDSGAHANKSRAWYPAALSRPQNSRLGGGRAYVQIDNTQTAHKTVAYFVMCVRSIRLLHFRYKHCVLSIVFILCIRFGLFCVCVCVCTYNSDFVVVVIRYTHEFCMLISKTMSFSHMQGFCDCVCVFFLQRGNTQTIWRNSTIIILQFALKTLYKPITTEYYVHVLLAAELPPASRERAEWRVCGRDQARPVAFAVAANSRGAWPGGPGGVTLWPTISINPDSGHMRIYYISWI